jgi:uncharacterized PurR-regulated membrane protein YhhQ (DUF165 family)
MKTPTNEISPIQTGIFILMMCFVVAISNYLLQFPVQGVLFGINLPDLLTWAAFTYPMAFFVTDLTNRQFGVKAARIVVFAGFALGVLISIYAATPRIAIASGTAFLVAQFLDISIFNRLRASAWWKAPFISSLLGSTIDTVLFFSLAFATMFVFLGANDDFAIGSAPLLGVFSSEVPRWVSWALGDFCVKIVVGLLMLLPYGGIVMSMNNKKFA